MNASAENDEEIKVSPSSTRRSPPIQKAASPPAAAAAAAAATAQEEELGPHGSSTITDDLDASRHDPTAIDLDIPTSAAVEMKDGDDITKTSPTTRIVVSLMSSTSPKTSSSPAAEKADEATTVDAVTSNTSIATTAPENAPTKKRRRSATKPKSTATTSTSTTPSNTKPAKKRVRNTSAAATADDSSTAAAAAMPSLKSAPVVTKSPPVPPLEPPETFYPHLAAPRPAASLLEFTTTTIAQRRQARKDQLAKAAADDPPLVPTQICGIPVPFQRYDACAECGTIEGNGDPNNKIILCDGPCGQEFHMQCCLPPLYQVPKKDEFYCFDCSAMGASEQLLEYFQWHEERKEEHERRAIQEIARSAKGAEPTGPTTSGSTASNTSKRKRKRKRTSKPKLPPFLPSFIDTLLQEDVLAEASSSTENGTTTSSAKSKQVRKDEGTSDDDALLLPISEMDPIPPEHLIGKPVRLFCPNMNTYHSGRILDTRLAIVDGGNDDDDDDDSSTATTTTAALIRFPAGKDYRKTTVTVWVYLEEHCLAVASDIVWAWMEKTTPSKKKAATTSSSHWTLGKVWRRSARELVPVMKILNQEQGQIHFRLLQKGGDATKDATKDESTTKNDRAPEELESRGADDKEPVSTEMPSADEASKDDAPTPLASSNWALVESFDGVYELLNIADEVRSEPPAASPKANDPILQGLAKVEMEEQRRVQAWNDLPLQDPFQKLQAYTLPSLEFQMPVENPPAIRPSSLVDQGLDRELIMNLVSRQLGVPATKDLGISLECEMVESLTEMVQSSPRTLMTGES